MSEIFEQRKTVRMYDGRKVDKELILKVLEDAQRSPSWANSQSWEVYVATGEVMEQLRKANLDAYEQQIPRNDADMPKPTVWPEHLQQRISESYARIFAQNGISRDDVQAREQNLRTNSAFFNAPVAMFICLDRSLTEWSTLDAGIYAGNLMLAATKHGLGSTIAASSVAYPHVLREVLGIPDHQRILVGVMMGYEDESHPSSRVRSFRVPLEKNVHIKGLS